MISLPTFQCKAKLADCWQSDVPLQLVQLKWASLFITAADNSDITVVVLKGNIVLRGESSETIEIVTKRKTICLVFESEAIASKCIAPMQLSTLLDITDFYEVGNHIGSGSYGHVFRATDKVGRAFAMKVVDDGDVFPEIEILCMAEANPHVMRAHDVFMVPGLTYIVLPLLQTDLHKVCTTRRELFTEHTVRSVMRQILEGLVHLHNQGIVHCDLKPNNILCNLVDDHVIDLQIGDFGGSNLLDGQGNVHPEREVTTFQYCSPEHASSKPYGSKADVFAAGSIIFELSHGKFAFDGIHRSEIFKAILSTEKLQLPHHFSNDAKDLFAWLHSQCEEFRLSAKDALNHRWFLRNSAN